MPNGVDAPVQLTQPSRSQSVLDRVLPQPQRAQLLPAQNAVLPIRQPSQSKIEPRLAVALPPSPREIAYTTIYGGLGEGTCGHGARLSRYGARVMRWLCLLWVGSVP